MKQSLKFLAIVCLLVLAPLTFPETGKGQSWTQIGSDIDGEAADDKSGYSVSLSTDGSTVAIGAIYNDGNGLSSGHVRVYENVSGTWTQIGSDIDGEAASDSLGYAVSLSADGSVVAIGAVFNDGNASASGHVRVYQNVSGNWTQVGSDIDGVAAGDRSGYAVSLSADGSTVAIGAPWNDGNASDSGHVRVYENVSGNWTQVGSDIDGEAADDWSGRSVSLSADGSTVAIGAPYNDGSSTESGHVRVYKNVSDTWTQVGSDIDGEAADDWSGWSVSLSADGSIVAIGAHGNDGNGNYSGHVRVYRNVSGNWSQIGSDIDGEAFADQSGYAVSLSADGSIVAIGAPYNDDSGTESGHVRAYENISGTWTQIGTDIDGEAASDQSGYAVNLSADGSTVAVGALDNDGNGADSGHVRVFDSPLHSVIYDGNTNTGGTAPTVSNTYYAGETVTVLGNSGNLVKTGHTFDGWNTAPDGAGTTYNDGDTFTMGSVDVILYAKWKAKFPWPAFLNAILKDASGKQK